MRCTPMSQYIKAPGWPQDCGKPASVGRWDPYGLKEDKSDRSGHRLRLGNRILGDAA